MSAGTLLVATRSADKLREIREIAAAEGLAPELRSLDDTGVPPSPDEDGLERFATFAENAFAKARYFASATGMLTLADDSGLCVDALGGAPGVYSKRYSGRADLSGPELDRANTARLLQALESVPDAERGAHYVCAVALVEPTGRARLFEGRCDGSILRAPRGDGGFGYDPVFRVAGGELTFGELPAEEKNRQSHRARAVRQALAALRG